MDKRQPLVGGDGLIKWVGHFLYFRSMIANEGNIDVEVDKKIVNASKAFGVLH